MGGTEEGGEGDWDRELSRVGFASSTASRFSHFGDETPLERSSDPLARADS